LRRPSSRDEEVNRARPVLPAELPGQLKAYQGTHTVTEESEWLSQVWKEGFG
jgi:hypothetical protein